MLRITLQTVTGIMNLGCILALLLARSIVEPSLALAQATTAITHATGPADLGTRVTAHGHTTEITGGFRPGDGKNLFHSFEQFSVGSGDTAQFLNTTPSVQTHTILGRVTGNNPSNIFGTIDTTSYPGANLYLMNPAGIVFGPNATLRVDGSVAFTTANYLRLADVNGSNAGVFHADTTTTSLLTSASVVAFGFLGQNPPAAISVQESSLAVKPSQSIALVGGDQGFDPKTGNTVRVPDGVTVIGGHLLAPGGQINIASVASPGEILARTLESTPNINGHSFSASGRVHISQSSIDASGKGDGTILIRGGRLVVDASTISSDTGTIMLDGRSIQLMNASQIKTSTATKANSGHIHLQASENIALEASNTLSSTSSSGQAGNIIVHSSHGNVNFAGGTNVQSSAEAKSSGNTGNITVEAPHGEISLDSSYISNITDGDGTLGEIQIKAHTLRLENLSAISEAVNASTSTQKPGDIQITLDNRLSLTGGSFINTTARTSLDSAALIIRAPEVFITGKHSSGLNSGLYNNTVSSGDGGPLRLFTDNLQLTNGGILFSKSFIEDSKIFPSGDGGEISIEGYRNTGASVMIDGTDSGIFSNAQGTGAAGDISVKASSVTLQSGGTLSAETSGTASSAKGGSITVNATDHVTLTNGGSITASSIVKPDIPKSGTANAGNISINAGQLLDVHDSSISTKADKASGGNIDIKAIDRVRLVNGSITTSVPNGTGNGGNITIDPNVVVLQNSNVLAQAARGQGGNITITTPVFLQDQASHVDASSQFGVNGTVTIQSPTSNLSGTVGQLTAKTSPPQVLLQNRCVALAGGSGQSTFLLAGRDTLPVEPGGWLSSPGMVGNDQVAPHEDLTRAVVSNKSLNASPPASTSSTAPYILSLRRLTPPGFLVRNFAGTGATGCHS